MGLFLAMSCVVGRDEQSVVEALSAYADENSGSLRRADLTTEDNWCLAVSRGVAGVTVLYPWDFGNWDEASQYLSERLGMPVFSFHIHDSDFWMYILYDNGEVVDQFNPVPDYWQEMEEDERQDWKGDPFAVAQRVSGITPEQISRYLTIWGDEEFELEERTKAYPDDEFYYGDDWQLTDFMNKLGFGFPIDDKSVPLGATYEFKYE